MKTENSKYKNLLLILFVVYCFLEGILIGDKKGLAEALLRIPSMLFLWWYYVVSVKKENSNFVFGMVFFVISSFFFTIDFSHLLGIITLLISRLFLIKIVISDLKKTDKTTAFAITALFSVISFVIMYLFYTNTLFFYISALATISLILLASFTFSILLNSKNKSDYVTMFFGVFFFVISDAIFGVQKLNQGGSSSEISVSANTIITVFLYNLGFFLITKAMINRDKRRL